VGRTVILWGLVAFALGCGGGDDDCVDCAAPKVCGPIEIADATGTCLAVGVDQCAEGFAGDSKGGCTPLLPSAPCPDGALAVPGDAACVPVGARVCGAGFVSDGKGGCNVVLPAASCDERSLATPGDTACRPLADCGIGPWSPDLPTDEPVLYVDAAFTGASDGTAGSPFRTIQAAIDAASATKTTLAIAAGTYGENLDLGKSVRLFGRCPALVTIRGVDGVKAPTIRVRADAEVHRVAVTAPATAAASVVQVSDAVARVERVRIHDTNAVGLRLQRVAKLTRVTARDVVIDRTVGIGAWVVGAELDAERLVVRDVAADPDELGRGLEIDALSTTQPSTLTLHAAIVERTHDAAILVTGSSATIGATWIHGVKGSSKTRFGFGISEEVFEKKRASSASLEGVVIEDTHYAAWNLLGSTGTAKNLTIRESRALGDWIAGPGTAIAISPDAKLPGVLTLSDARIDGCDDEGVFVKGANATLKNVIVTSIGRKDSLGRGIHSASDDDGTEPEASIDRVLVDGVDGIGVFVAGGHAKVTASEIRNVAGTTTSRDAATGCLAVGGKPPAPMPELWAKQLRAHDCAGTGVIAQAAKLQLEASFVHDTFPRAGQPGTGRGFELRPLGGIGADVSLLGSVIARATEIGVIDSGSTLRIDRTVIQSTRPPSSGSIYAAGVVAQNGGGPSTLDLRRSLVEDSQAIAVYVIDSNATIDSTLIRGTRGTSTGQFGDGLSVRTILLEAALTVTRSLLRDNARAGLSLFGGAVSLGESRLACNGFEINLESSLSPDRKPSSLADAGFNACGCATTAVCRAQSANLAPIPSPN